IGSSQKELDNVLLKQPSLVNDLENNRTPVGMVSAAARRLIDASQNLLDAQKSIAANERNADDLNKKQHRALPQHAIFDVVANVQTLDQCFRVLVSDWKVLPHFDKGLTPTTVPSLNAIIEQQGPTAVVKPNDRAVREPSLSDHSSGNSSVMTREP